MSIYDQAVEKFRQAYPLLMKQREDNSFVRFGLEVGPGWYPLIFELFGLINDMQRRTGLAAGISQVKEKFGTLRIYARMPCDSAQESIIEMLFETLSARTCDLCGAAGRLGSHDGYWSTKCESHRAIEDFREADRLGEHAAEAFLQYERKGFDTQGFVYVDSKRSEKGQGYASLHVYELPGRLESLLSSSLMDQMSVHEYLDRPVGELAAVVEGLKKQGKLVARVGDGSEDSDRALGR